MSAPTPQSRRRAATRQTIIETARRMLVAQGSDGLSIRALADSVNFTPGALYRYFDDKDDLIDAVRAHCFERLNGFIARRIQNAMGAAEMLLQGGLAYIEYAAHNPQEYHLMFNMPPSRATAGAQRAQAMRTLLHIVELGVAQGEIRPRGAYDAAAITYHCWATVHGMASLQSTVLLEEQADLARSNRIILQKVIAGFTPPPPAFQAPKETEDDPRLG